LLPPAQLLFQFSQSCVLTSSSVAAGPCAAMTPGPACTPTIDQYHSLTAGRARSRSMRPTLRPPLRTSKSSASGSPVMRVGFFLLHFGWPKIAHHLGHLPTRGYCFGRSILRAVAAQVTARPRRRSRSHRHAPGTSSATWRRRLRRPHYSCETTPAGWSLAKRRRRAALLGRASGSEDTQRANSAWGPAFLESAPRSLAAVADPFLQPEDGTLKHQVEHRATVFTGHLRSCQEIGTDHRRPNFSWKHSPAGIP
jgi:hypothetical protein